MKGLKLNKIFLNFCIAILISIITVILFSICQYMELVEELFINKTIGFMAVFIGYFMVIFILSKIYNNGIVGNKYKKVSLKNLCKYNKKYVIITLLSLIISMIYILLLNIVTYKMISHVNTPEIEVSEIFLIGAMTYGPIIEELMFRGIFFNFAYEWTDMSSKVVKNMVIVINIMMFMSIHFISYNFLHFDAILSLLLAIIPRLVISICLTYIYIITRDIKYNIILHIVYNLILIL